MEAMAAGPRDRLSLWRKLAIGSGDIGLNLYWQSSSLFLLFFYTDILGLPAATAGAIYMAALIWDAVIDPVIGAMADRTRTRWGRYRPYLMFGAPPLALSFVFVYALPSLSPSWIVALTTAAHFLFRTFYAIVAIPYASIFARVTQDAGERATMAGIRMMCALLAGLAISAGTLPLAKALGGGIEGWSLLAVIYGIFACLFLGLTVLAAGDGDREEEAPGRQLGIGESISTMTQNRPLLLVLGIILIISFTSTFFSKNVLYFFKYVRGDEDFGGVALAILAGVAAIAAPLWAALARRTSKRTALIAGLSLDLVGYAGWYAFASASYGMLVAALLFCALGRSAIFVCFWSMLPDTVEYGEWKTGVRTESLIFGFVVFAQKAALGLAAGGLGLTLGLIGFAPNIVQSSGTLWWLVVLMALVPASGDLLALVCTLAYSLDPATHRRITAEIEGRHGRAAIE